MPVMSCSSEGKPGYKYGDTGYCYTFRHGDMKSEKDAYDKAVSQGRAIELSKKRGESE
jgi:hypothetical protein